MEKKFTALRTIGSIYKILGIVVGVLTVLLVIGFCGLTVVGSSSFSSLSRDLRNIGIFSGLIGGVFGSIGLIISGGGLALMFYAVGESIYLMVALEENTRATNLLIRQQLGGQLAQPPVVRSPVQPQPPQQY